jgi:exosortase A
MPPETISPERRLPSLIERIAPEWREPLGALAVALGLLMLVARREWVEMFHQWWDIDTYNHILLVPVIITWLVSLKAGEFARIAPRPWLPGLGLVAAGLLIWLVGRITDINLIAHVGAVGTVQGAVVAVLGLRASLLLALPLCFAAFLVPFGDEIIAPLQMITAKISTTLTHWSGVPAEVDGINIYTPVGLFIVAEACSGVKFLVAMLTLAVLVCFTRFDSWKRRALFILASIIVPVLANGVRAWGTIYIAQFKGVEFAAGFDHIFYGWIFFAIVVAVLLAGAWRYFEREPQDYGWTADSIPSIAALERFDGFQTPLASLLTLIGLLALMATALAAFVPPLAIG